MHELHTAILAPVLHDCGVPLSCEECDHDLDCAQPIGITSKGDLTHRPETDPGTVVQWPGCPTRWAALRQMGQDVVPLASVVEWSVHRGVHRSKLLGAGGARLCREWLRMRKMPRTLLKTRAYEEAKRKRGAS